MKRFRSLIGTTFTALLWTYAFIRGVLDWAGRAEVFEDPQSAKHLAEKALNWLFSTPWWVASLLAIAATFFVFWPRVEEIVAYLERPLPRHPRPVLASVERWRWWYAIRARAPIFNEEAATKLRWIESWEEHYKKQQTQINVESEAK